MSQFAQSIRRLYQSGRISLDIVKALLADGKLTTAEYDYVVLS
jgi:hypothetical protein